jgi:hypothetical protein
MKDATANGPLVRNLSNPSRRFSANGGDKKFLEFIYDRLLKFDPNENVDYMQTLKKMADGWDEHRENVYDAGYKHAERLAADLERLREHEISNLHTQIAALQQHNNELEEKLATKDTVIRGFSEVTQAIALYVGTKSDVERF